MAATIDVWLALVGSLVLLLGLGTGFLQSRAFLPSEPFIAVLFGVGVGPHGLDVLRLAPLGDPLQVLHEIAHVTVALAVTSIALRLPVGYYRDRAQSLVVLLGPGMGIMWLVSAAVAYAALAVDPVVALLIGAVVTPTDPVLANSIVVGATARENIPVRLRYLLSGEAGINDGTATLFVFLPILLLSHSTETALSAWLVQTLVQDVVGGVVLGLFVGAAVGRVEAWESSRDFLEETSILTITVALTFAVLGGAMVLGMSAILAVFTAGVTYNWQAAPADEADAQRVEEVFNRLFTLPVFVLFGLLLPWREWLALGWRGPALVVGVLLFRRLPMVYGLGGWIPPLDRREASLFVGWFGPIGVAALFYATLALSETGSSIVWVAGSYVVAGSILGHGLSATAGTLWYGGRDDTVESW